MGVGTWPGDQLRIKGLAVSQWAAVIFERYCDWYRHDRVRICGDCAEDLRSNKYAIISAASMRLPLFYVVH